MMAGQTDNLIGNPDPTPDNNAELRRLQQLENSDAFFTALRDGLIQQQSASNVFGRDLDGVDFVGLPSPEVLDADSTTGAVGVDNTADGGSFAGAADAGASDGGATAEFDSPATDQSLSTPASTQESASSIEDVTTTNVQEVGVDEQDRIKSDGEFLYIIDNQFNDFIGFPFIEPAVVEPGFIEPDFIDQVDPPQLVLIDDLPQNTDDTNSVDILPVGDDPVASSFYEPEITSRLRILKLENEAPDASLITEVDIGLNGAAADGMYLHKSNGKSSLILTATNFNNFRNDWYDPYAFSNAVSVVGKLDVTEPTQTALEQTLRIDGQIVSSRRIGDNLFLATRYHPVLAGIDPYLMNAEEYRVALENFDLTTSLPKITDVSNSVTTELVNPGECFVASDSQQTDFYYSPDIITLSVIDLNTMELQDSECFLGATETLYATPKSVFLATTEWNSFDFPVFALDDTVSTTSRIDPRVNTDIHQFDINGSELTYSGSGVVAGHLGWNPDRMPFRMSEKDGYLRVATFSENQNGIESPINVSVLSVDGDGPLSTVAQLPNSTRPEHIGKPGEQLYASRFLGDKGYLVTFRQTDPLYVVDFSNPNDPKLAGELEIEGFSDYLQPIGEDYLLGIGKDAVPATDGFGDGFGGALVQGVKLSLFNVSDPSNPIEVQSMVVGERGTNAGALSNHRAITVQAATDTHPTRVAFGIDVYGLADPRPVENPFDYYPWNFSGLHGFDIHTGDGAGIEKRGVMVVNSASRPDPTQLRFASDDRSVIVGDSVYYVYGPSVYAANWNDLSNYTGPR